MRETLRRGASFLVASSMVLSLLPVPALADELDGAADALDAQEVVVVAEEAEDLEQEPVADEAEAAPVEESEEEAVADEAEADVAEPREAVEEEPVESDSVQDEKAADAAITVESTDDRIDLSLLVDTKGVTLSTSTETRINGTSANYRWPQFLKTGGTVEPKVTLVGMNGETLAEGKDYTVEYYKYEGYDDSCYLIITATDNSQYKGSVRMSYYLVDKYDIKMSSGPQLKTVPSSSVSIVANEMQIKDAAVDIWSLAWDFIFGGKVLSQSNYTVSSKVYDKFTSDTLANDVHTIKEGVEYVFQGKGNYTGSVSKYVSKVHEAKAIESVSISVSNVTYTGSAQKPKPKVVYKGTTLKEGTDYTLSYANNTKVGTAKVTVTGKGSYAGTKTATFSITKSAAKQKANPMKVTAVKRTAKASKLKKKAVTVARPLKVTKAQGKVSYKKAGGSKRLTVNKKTGKVTVKKGTKKGTYKVKIKVTAAGNASYKSGSKTVTCKVVVK